jgi:ERCC4-type nuclease
MLQIVVDVREHALIEKLKGIAEESKSGITIAVETLLLGDVMIRQLIINTKTSPFSHETDACASTAVGESSVDVPAKETYTKEILLFERKSFPDLLASIKDGRYEEQSHRLIHSSGMNPHNICYLLEGIFSTLRNPMDKRIILSAMTSLYYFKGFSVLRTATVLETAELIWAMANKIQKEFENGREVPSYVSQTQTLGGERTEESVHPPPCAYGNFVKKTKHENITPENIGEILLSQIPGISNHIASEILKHFDGSFSKLIQEIKTTPEKLDTIYLESASGKRRKLSSAVIQSILRFL